MRTITCLFSLIYSISFAQVHDVDSIKLYEQKLKLANNFNDRKIISNKIKNFIVEAASNFTIQKLDSLEYLSCFTSKEAKLKIVSWELSNDSNSFAYECAVIIKSKNKYKVNFLTDFGDEMKSPEFASSTTTKWYGAHYYQMVEKVYNKKNYYTVIGINWKGPLSKKKVIETFSIDANDNLVLGEPIFQVGNRAQRRYILEYKYDISINCRYNQESKQIVFDHLIPPNASLKAQKHFYVNDLSFDAFKFVKGKWILVEDIDARNPKAKEDDSYSAPK